MLFAIYHAAPFVRGLINNEVGVALLSDEVSREWLFCDEFDRCEWNFAFAGRINRCLIISVLLVVEAFLFFFDFFVSETLAEWFLILESGFDLGDGLINIINDSLVWFFFKERE
jgi:hypothetical protein